MKNSYICVVFFTTLLSITGCNSNSDELNQKIEVLVNSSTPTIGNHNRAILGGEDQMTPIWSDNDKIYVRPGNKTASEFTLIKGEGSQNGTFKGTLSDKGQSMTFWYGADENLAVDITNQDGSNTKEMVMYAYSDKFETNPTIDFKNKTTILKLNVNISTLTTVESINTCTVSGIYSKGELDKSESGWNRLKTENCTIKNLEIDSNNNIKGYIVAIPGTLVKDLKISFDFNSKNGKVLKNYIINYSADDIKLQENNIYKITKTPIKQSN